MRDTVKLTVLSLLCVSVWCSDDDSHSELPHDPSGQDSHLGTILFLSASFLVGAVTRHAINKFVPTLPYTVALLAVGMLFGIIFKYYESYLSGYIGMIHIDPHLLMYAFLPVLLFESAFLLDIHAIKKSIGQILVLAVPGYFLSSVLTAVVVYFLFNYSWSWDASMMVGAILSATDPVAVVALLKKSPGGNDVHHLSIVIEGESLLNDGAAIVLFNIFMNNAMQPCEGETYSCPHNTTTDVIEFNSTNFCETYMNCSYTLPLHKQMCEKMSASSIALDIVLKIVGGPIFGIIVGYVIVFWLGKVFNDYLTEITITVGSPYLVYFVSEMFLQSSGVLSVVLFGCVVNMNKMNISPEIETFLNKFWEQMGFLVNTIIFLVVGMIITSSASDNIELRDILNLFVLYLGVSISRTLMLLLFHFVLSKTGYGSTWQSSVILMWGALRGAVSLALALQVIHNTGFCLVMRNKIIFFVSGIVVLTLIINSTTFNQLLSLLGFCHISKAKRLAVDSAADDIIKSMNSELEALKDNDSHTDSNWDEVRKVCCIETIHKAKKDEEDNRKEIEKLHDKVAACVNCDTQVPVPITKAELSEFFDESRNRIFKAFKISLWKQFDSGLLSKPALRYLGDLCDQTRDVRDKFIEFQDVSSAWKIGKFLNYMKAFLEAWQRGRKQEEYPIPNNIHQYKVYRIVSSNIFEAMIMFLIFLNVVLVIVELSISMKCESFTDSVTKEVSQKQTSVSKAFSYINYVFITFFIVEMVLKLIGQRKYYFFHKWNLLDFAIIFISLADSISDVFTSCSTANFNFNIFRIIRIVRLFRCVRLIKWVLLALQKLIRNSINKSVSSGYDIGIGFIVASDEVLEHLDHIVAYQECRETFRYKINEARNAVSDSLGEVRKEFHGIAIAISTRQVTRIILNKGRETTWKLLGDGLVEDFDCALFTKQLEEKMKRLLANPSHWIPPPDPVQMFSQVPWLKNSKDYLIYNVAKYAQHQMHNKGEVVLQKGEIATGVYLIISGRVKIVHSLTDIKASSSKNLVHRTESIQLACYHKHNDSIGPGQIVGEQSILVNQPRGSYVVCESSLQCYFISAEDMHGLMLRYPIIEENLWRLCSVRIAQSLLFKSKKYKTRNFDELKTTCEHSVLATLVPETNDGIFEIDEIITDVVVIYGEIRCFPSNTLIMGPKLAPDGSTKLCLSTPCKILIVISNKHEIDLPRYNEIPITTSTSTINCENKKSKRSLLRPSNDCDIAMDPLESDHSLHNEMKLSTIISHDPSPKTRQEYEKKRRLSHLKDIRDTNIDVVNHGINGSDSRLTPVESVPP